MVLETSCLDLMGALVGSRRDGLHWMTFRKPLGLGKGALQSTSSRCFKVPHAEMPSSQGMPYLVYISSTVTVER